ncbi:MAG: LysE family translocator [Alphaproteobacteria bacterium]
MISFAIAVFLLLVTPGPGVLSIAGVGNGFGYRPAQRFFAGLLVGTNLVALLVITGLAAILISMPGLRVALFALSIAYILYLAARIALAGTSLAPTRMDRAPGFTDAIILQLVNPKAYVVNTTLFSGFAFMPDSLPTEVAIKLLLLNAIWIPIHALWLAFGVTMSRLDLSRGVHTAINVVMALAMGAVVAIAALAQFGDRLS